MTLVVRVISALLTHDTDTFSNMDPYCVIQIGQQKHKTHTKKEAGKKPTWEQTFTIKNFTSNDMKVQVYDKDTIRDDLVGEATVSLQKYIDNPQQCKEYINLLYKGKPAGKVQMSIWYKNGNSNSNSNWGSNNNISNNNSNSNSNWGGNNSNLGNNSNYNNKGNESWGNDNNGWGNNNNNNTNNNNNSGWNNSSNSNQAPVPPQQYQGNFIGAMENMSGKSESEWGNNPNNQSNNSNNRGWGNNSGW